MQNVRESMAWTVFPSKLEDKTRLLLCTAPRKLSFAKISADTGLTGNWLSDFSMGQLTHPSVGRVETLYNYLSKKPLEV
jgi:hypothetical protein